MTEPTTVTVAEPEIVETKKVDSSGRVYLGSSYAGDHVRIVIERVEVDEEDDSDEDE